MTTATVATALLLCALTTGFVLGFAVVVMPGLKTLDDRAFLLAFQRIDGVIQNNQPLFMLMWVGSIAAVAAALVVGLTSLDGVERALLLAAGALYLGGVQLPTVAINVPLNAQVQRLNVDQAEPGALHEARTAFEPRWNRWNDVRTALGALSVVLMLVLLTRV